jgi:phosphatidylethanolamine/phosphatidyl-N-methylethanolamine N-methyltransferase
MARADVERGYWDRLAKRYDRVTRFMSRPVPRMLELTVDAVRGRRRALEVGAGTGLLTAAIAPVVGEVVATDYAAEMVQQLAVRVDALGLANVRCEQADIYELRFEAASFDVVVAANVLHLVPDIERALASLRRVLKPGGVIVVPTYLHAETLRAGFLSRVFALTGFPGHRRFTARTLREAVESAGFVPQSEEVIPGPFPVGFIHATQEVP